MTVINFIQNFFRLFFRFKAVRIIDLEVDQMLLFEGSDLKIIYLTENCLFIKLKVEGLSSKYFLPDKHTTIPVFKELVIKVIAYGPFGSTKKFLRPVIHLLDLNSQSSNTLQVCVSSLPVLRCELSVEPGSSIVNNSEIRISIPELNKGISLLDLSTETVMAQILSTAS